MRRRLLGVNACVTADTTRFEEFFRAHTCQSVWVFILLKRECLLIVDSSLDLLEVIRRSMQQTALWHLGHWSVLPGLIHIRTMDGQLECT
jgi:hypothetical protein